MISTTEIHLLNNGMTLLCKEMPWSESVSYSFLIPCGTIDDPKRLAGLSGLTSEMAIRGAGERDNRELLEAFENLGVETSEGVSQSYSVFRASMMSENLTESLALSADILRRPLFPEEELEPSKSVLFQEIASIEDDPPRKMMIELGGVFFPSPWGRPSFGTPEGLNAVALADIQRHHQKLFSPQGTILSVAGKIDRSRLLADVERLFGDWTGSRRSEPTEIASDRVSVHLPFDSAQTHIGLAWPSVPMSDPYYLAVKSGIGILSGGMSSRLFTEVREKRGLCYSVHASYYTHKTRGAVFCYCGSSSEAAQEALDVIVAELHKLETAGITEPELDRLKIRSKSALVTDLESTAARASAMARDWYYLGRVREMDEMQANINALSVKTINAKLHEHPLRPLRLVTLGPEPLAIDETLLG